VAGRQPPAQKEGRQAGRQGCKWQEVARWQKGSAINAVSSSSSSCYISIT